MVRGERQERQLRCERSFGLRLGRLALLAGQRIVFAGELVERSSALPRGGHSRRNGASADDADCLGVVRSRMWQRGDVPLADLRRRLRQKRGFLVGLAPPPATLCGRGSCHLYWLDSAATNHLPPTRAQRAAAPYASPGRRQPALPLGARSLAIQPRT